MSQFRDTRILRLYRNMPGAPMPPTVDGWLAWGEVMGNDHWQFCAEIVEAIDAAVRQSEGRAEA